ncbi:hypothetical protein GCM10027082_07570 [Comamonas humi]
MQSHRHIADDALNDHEFGRSGMEPPTYAMQMLPPANLGASANDGDGYVDLAQRVREGGEW